MWRRSRSLKRLRYLCVAPPPGRHVAPAARAMHAFRRPCPLLARRADRSGLSASTLKRGCALWARVLLPRASSVSPSRLTCTSSCRGPRSPAAEAARPNITCAAARRPQFGYSTIAASGVPLFAQSRGTAAQLTCNVGPTNHDWREGGPHDASRICPLTAWPEELSCNDGLGKRAAGAPRQRPKGDDVGAEVVP